MNAWAKSGKFVVLSALAYLVVLGVTGELHVSSKAFAFFAMFWVVQAGASLWQAWRLSRGIAAAGTSGTDESPPAG
jgi:hypothetical protein